MHLFKFTQEQKIAFLGLAKKIIQADENVSDSEEVHYNLICQEMGIENTVTIPDEPLTELVKPFQSRDVRVWALLEILGIGYIDQHFASEEAELVSEIGQAFSISDEEIRKIKNLVIKGKGLEKETDNLIKPQ